MRVKLCPSCGSSAIGEYAGGVLGMYQCNSCGYVGALVVEKGIVKK